MVLVGGPLTITFFDSSRYAKSKKCNFLEWKCDSGIVAANKRLLPGVGTVFAELGTRRGAVEVERGASHQQLMIKSTSAFRFSLWLQKFAGETPT